MAVITLPGVNGTIVANTTSSRYIKHGVGKFTDSTHLESFWKSSPAEYDRLIDFYIQQELPGYSNDLTQILSGSTPYNIPGNTDSFTYEISKHVEYPKIIRNLAVTLPKPGIDGQEFELVYDKKVFTIGDLITSNKREQNHQLQVVSEGADYGGGFKYRLRLQTQTPLTDFVPQKWLTEGTEYYKCGHIMGEFSTNFSGLSQINDKLKVMQTLGEGFGVEHAITDWADAKNLRNDSVIRTATDNFNNPLDITYFAAADPQGKIKINTTKWLPTIEIMCRAEMERLRINKMLWQRGGVYKDVNGNIIPCGSGLWEQLNRGHVHTYNRGQFSLNMLKNIFGDLFYRRVSMDKRRVVMYTNESGMEVFSQAIKDDAGKSGLTVNAESNGILSGTAKNLMLTYAFGSMWSSQTGVVEVKHLQELDMPTTNTEFGQNKKSTPVFLVFDMSQMQGGGLANNIREIRSTSRPGMTWGYVDGAVHHKGFAFSQGMSSANKNPYYELWMKDRVGIFVEDVTRTVIIYELPTI